jgi:ribosomal protein S18 acetylase RimI-like enzyme
MSSGRSRVMERRPLGKWGMDGNTAEQIERGLVYERVRKVYARLRAEATGGWVLEEGEVMVWACPFSDLFNGLMSPAWKEDVAEAHWRRALRLFRETGQDMYVSLGPGVSPAFLEQWVERDGFRRVAEVPFMHGDLAKIKEYSPPSGLRIERIVDSSFFEKHEHSWLGPVHTPYRKLKLQFLRAYGEGDSPPLWQFIALRNRQLIGGATVFAHGDEVAIFDVVVNKEHRRQGVGTCLVGEACRFAREKGMRVAGLGASGEGMGLYRKLGFTDAGVYRDFFASRTDVRL